MNTAICKEIIGNLRSQLVEAEGWITRNKDFPDAARGWEEKATKYRLWIADLENQAANLSNHKRYQVLVFEPLLTHSIWQDWGSDEPHTDEEVLDLLRAGVESGEYVGWRVMTIHKEVLGRDEVALARINTKP